MPSELLTSDNLDSEFSGENKDIVTRSDQEHSVENVATLGCSQESVDDPSICGNDGDSICVRRGNAYFLGQNGFNAQRDSITCCLTLLDNGVFTRADTVVFSNDECTDLQFDTPTAFPTELPTSTPSFSPTLQPSVTPSHSPTFSPSTSPTKSPTDSPSVSPTVSPTIFPTESPSASPTKSPFQSPTVSPSLFPTTSPSSSPTLAPTSNSSSTDVVLISSSAIVGFVLIALIESLTDEDDIEFNRYLQNAPTICPVFDPACGFVPTPPTLSPTSAPSISPTPLPTQSSSSSPSFVPSETPTLVPTSNPSLSPTDAPSDSPSISPTNAPTGSPSPYPTFSPTLSPSIISSSANVILISSSAAAGFLLFGLLFLVWRIIGGFIGYRRKETKILEKKARCSQESVDDPSICGNDGDSICVRRGNAYFLGQNGFNAQRDSITCCLTLLDNGVFTRADTVVFSNDECIDLQFDTPTAFPTELPTSAPSFSPTLQPSVTPSHSPTFSPSTSPTKSPTDSPSVSPTVSPTIFPTESPSASPTKSPFQSPTVSPSLFPTTSPSSSPTLAPTSNSSSTDVVLISSSAIVGFYGERKRQNY
eukprot:maker-scaffold_3-snap-gene-19.12-mRNA-1 protein AED:0.06 eAED:0.07 QI:0/0/0/0.8/0.25/0.2/5/0/590